MGKKTCLICVARLPISLLVLETPAHYSKSELQNGGTLEITDVRVMIETNDSVDEVVTHIFDCYAHALDAPPMRPYDPTKYLLKITGTQFYLAYRSLSMNAYAHVRECLKSKTPIRLTLVHEAEVPRLGR